MTCWWPLRSLRVRLTLWYTGTLAVLLSLYAGGVFVFLRHSLFAELDRRLHDDFELAEQMLERSNDGGIRWRADEHHHEEDSNDAAWLEVWNPAGQLLYRRAAFAGASKNPSFSSLSLERSGYASVLSSGNVPVRVL